MKIRLNLHSEKLPDWVFLSPACNKGRVDMVKRLLEAVETQRYRYTYKGVVKQLQMFFSDPLDSSGMELDGGGYLRCAHVGHEELVEALDNQATLLRD